MLLGDVLEYEAELVGLQRGHRAFLPLARSAQQVGDLLRFNAEILCERVDSVFISRCCHCSHQSFLSELRCVYESVESISDACRNAAAKPASRNAAQDRLPTPAARPSASRV